MTVNAVCPCKIASSGQVYRQHTPDCPNSIDPCAVLQDARDYLILKSYNGDQGGDYMNYWEWNVVMCTAIGILDDTLTAVRFGDLGRCCHETLESRIGACDGGERCRRQATHEIGGSAFCERHGN